MAVQGWRWNKYKFEVPDQTNESCGGRIAVFETTVVMSVQGVEGAAGIFDKYRMQHGIRRSGLQVTCGPSGISSSLSFFTIVEVS